MRRRSHDSVGYAPQRFTGYTGVTVPTTGNYFHLHLVSDSTGETLITVARAVAAQYANVTPVEHVYPLVRSQKQLDRVLDEIEEAPGIVLFTLLEKDLVEVLFGRPPKVMAVQLIARVCAHSLRGELAV